MDLNQFDPNQNPHQPEPAQPQTESVSEQVSQEPTPQPLAQEPALCEQTETVEESILPDPQESQPIVPPAPVVTPATYYYDAPAPLPKTKKSKTWLWILLICVGVSVALLIGSTVGFMAGKMLSDGEDGLPPLLEEEPADSNEDSQPGGTSSFDIVTDSKGEQIYSYEQIVEKVAPAIVNITIYSADGEKGSYASGIIMDAAGGYVLTNDHIYADVPGAKFLITLNNGTEFTAQFVSGDSRSDIAILKINDPKNLTAATFSTEPLTVGERVLAIGQSYGYADTVTEGIVSAVNRRVSLSSGSYSERYIQTTAAINPGNSGGALVNLYGQVVGVTSAKIATEEVEGLGFAIPSERALSIVTNLQKNGTVKGRAKLGITYTEAGTVVAEIEKVPVGIYVQSVDSQSDAAKKGIESGDVITKVNGKSITIATVLLDVIENAKAGDEITLAVYKADTKKTETVKVTLLEAEGGHSYQTKSAVQDEDTNDLPENPYEFYFGK
ncbi:MAG: trypsin-like peptidase domain-containing protein [Clostridia bacterium]|nr:trypsin-like peptidase domain-containing protein [Clostridia bacterium]